MALARTAAVHLCAALVATTLVFASHPARAQETTQPPPAAPAAEGQPQYTAPMYQRTQGTYVPQSVAMSGPREIDDYEEGDSIPAGYHQDTHIRKGLVIAGAVTLGTLYLFSALAAAAGADAAGPGESNQLTAMWVPVVGPFIQIANTSSATGDFFLIIDGAAQTAGAAMLIYGLAAPKTVLVRNDLGLEIRPTPMRLGKDGTGFGLVGKF